MYLKKIQLKNFRKYRENKNIFDFVNAEGIRRSNVDVDKEKVVDDKINVASVTTLIVGKNNTGKTSVIQALLKIVGNNENYKLQVKDINFYYLMECFRQYWKNYKENGEDKAAELFQPPLIEFVITIAFEKNSDDVVNNLIPFILLSDVEREKIDIVIRYEISEREKFVSAIKKACRRLAQRIEEKSFYDDLESLIFQVMLQALEEVQFQINYYRYIREEGKEPTKEKVERNFKLSNLVDITVCSHKNSVKNHSKHDH